MDRGLSRLPQAGQGVGAAGVQASVPGPRGQQTAEVEGGGEPLTGGLTGTGLGGVPVVVGFDPPSRLRQFFGGGRPQPVESNDGSLNESEEFAVGAPMPW